MIIINFFPVFMFIFIFTNLISSLSVYLIDYVIIPILNKINNFYNKGYKMKLIFEYEINNYNENDSEVSEASTNSIQQNASYDTESDITSEENDDISIINENDENEEDDDNEEDKNEGQEENKVINEIEKPIINLGDDILVDERLN